jgi:hypothetical protein
MDHSVCAQLTKIYKKKINWRRNEEKKAKKTRAKRERKRIEGDGENKLYITIIT